MSVLRSVEPLQFTTLENKICGSSGRAIALSDYTIRMVYRGTLWRTRRGTLESILMRMDLARRWRSSEPGRGRHGREGTRKREIESMRKLQRSLRLKRISTQRSQPKTLVSKQSSKQ